MADASESAPPDVAPQLAAEVGRQAAHSSGGVWERLRKHKVAQWTLAYGGLAYTLLHLVEMLSDAQDWPHVIVRVLSLVLLLGVPVVITLAWYHGARGLKRISAAELIIITLLSVIAGGVLWFLQRTNPREHGGPSVTAIPGSAAVAPSVASAAIARTSIAVMPFANLTGDPSKEYLGDGMAEEIINTLTQVEGLKVPARTSSFAYKGRDTDIRQIAKDLGVGTILEGSVRAAGKRIRITAELINAQDGLHIWSRDYNEQFTDLFKLQDTLAKAIVEALRPNLHGIGPQVSPTQDLEAYQLYLQARSLRNPGTEQGLRAALEHFQEALARDPKFARALAGSAATRLTLVIHGHPLPNALADADGEAEKAHLLDPSLAEPEAVLAVTSALRGLWLNSESHFRAAISLDATDADIHRDYSARLLMSVGHTRRALAEAREAYRLAPADPFATTQLAAMNSIVGLDAEALRYANLATDLGYSPDVPPLAQILNRAATGSGHYAEAGDRAAADLPAFLRAVGGEPVIKQVYAAMGDAGQRPRAAAALRRLVHHVRPDDVDVSSTKDLMFLFTILGDLDDAFAVSQQSLDVMTRAGNVGSSWDVVWLPEMRAFRSDSRFQSFVSRLRMMDYWKQYGPPDDCDLKDDKLTCR